ncbi:MAG: thiamine diphosphokinase [Bacteroidales bacterium]|nr:thiamine diphosphokinase [Bacteroidales bacterium]MBO5074432.1 thiamine diphosphokinase [Bacteroidales bacterium]MBQ8574096.1 thiamine diphosphokinase [Bacteroidales bacterium]MBR1959816.1 thiamine diphosphokinase [Bacteroidales bacterium]
MFSKVVIICDGKFPRTEYPHYLIRTADYIICCDGALKKFLRNSLSIFGEERLPDLVIGDMDTLPASMQKKYADIILKETEQEHNDQTKAVRWALNNLKGIETIHILGATGGRADHTIGNTSLLMEYTRMFDLKDITIEMVSDDGTIFPINDTIEFECGPGRSISIFTPDNSLRIRSEGLMYPTDDVVFDNWWKATLNKTVQDNVRLELSHRSIALIMLD